MMQTWTVLMVVPFQVEQFVPYLPDGAEVVFIDAAAVDLLLERDQSARRESVELAQPLRANYGDFHGLPFKAGDRRRSP
jgi:hypothetical protein